MSRAWYMDSSDEDQRLEHHQSPQKFISLEELKNKTGVEAFKLNPDTFATDGSYEKIRADRGYNYEDVVIPSKAPNYDELIIKFYQEHIHTDEEVRYIEEGTGYFDVRDDEDKWVRIECLAGDLLVLPAGIYHRFTLDTKNYVKARRLFIGHPVWTAHNRPCEDMKERRGYVKWVKSGCEGQNVPV